MTQAVDFPWGKLMASPPPLPACPPGWRTAPPDFVGVGTQKSGTTRWHSLILSHPRVVPSVKKELHFFNELWNVGHADPAMYARYFPRPPGHICGEWTPRYMLDPWTPPLLASVAPDAKLLVSLRDPVERYASQLAWAAAQAEKGRRPAQRPSSDALGRSTYSKQLAHVLGYFKREQLLVLQFERCVAEPGPQLRATFEFLGVDPDFTPDDISRQVAATGRRLTLHPHDRAALVAFLEPDVRSLLEAFPAIDPALWPNFSHLV